MRKPQLSKAHTNCEQSNFTNKEKYYNMISRTTELVMTLFLHCTCYTEACIAHCSKFQANKMKLHQTMLCMQTILITINGVYGKYLFQEFYLTYFNNKYTYGVKFGYRRSAEI